MTEGFLARWSDLKHRARRNETRPNQNQQSKAEPPALSQTELDALPRLEDLRPDTDIRGFLRPGVPASLRNAALRRMWSLDPAIRDFVGHARDYAFDWNTPGGVPGNSTLDPRDAVALLARLIGSDKQPADSGTEPLDTAQPNPAETSGSSPSPRS